MSLLNIFEISGSALSAQSQRLNVSASNLANADSVTGPDGEPYRAKQVVFEVNAALGSQLAACALLMLSKTHHPHVWFTNRAIRWLMDRDTFACRMLTQWLRW